MLTRTCSFCPRVNMNMHSLHMHRLLALFQLTNFTTNEPVHLYLLSMNPGSYFNNNSSLLQNQAGRFKEKTTCYYTSLMHVHADSFGDFTRTNLHAT